MTGAVRTIETEIDIAAPATRVWAILIGFDAYADWNPYLVRIEGEPAPGTDIIVTSRPGGEGAEITQSVKVVAVDPPRSMHWQGGLPDRSQFLGDHVFELRALSDGATRLLHHEHFSGSLADAILDRHGRVIEASFGLFNEALKARAEALR